MNAQPLDGPLRVAFYGRTAAVDQWAPDASFEFQVHAATDLLAAHSPGATIVVEAYFDDGASKRLPWSQRFESARLLDDVAAPDRGWDAVVVSGGARCFYGAQFSEVASLLVAHGVPLFVPELDGRYEPTSAMHDVTMGVLGGAAGARS